MLYHVVSWMQCHIKHTTPYHIIPYVAKSCHIAWHHGCNAVPYCTELYHAGPYHIVSYHTRQFHTYYIIPCRTTINHPMPQHTIPCHTTKMVYNIISYDAIPYYVIPRHTMSCHIILHHIAIYQNIPHKVTPRRNKPSWKRHTNSYSPRSMSNDLIILYSRRYYTVPDATQYNAMPRNKHIILKNITFIYAGNFHTYSRRLKVSFILSDLDRTSQRD